jgi:hypothetical protein
MSQFQQPGVGGDKFEAAQHNGALMLFFPTDYSQNVPTVNGASDVIAARIVNLETGQILEDAKVWGKAMVPQLKGAVPDGMVLGRLGQGTGKNGNNPPWILHPHTAQEVARAEAWLAANPRNQFAQPQAQAAPPTPPAWGAPATPAAPQWGGQAAAPAPQAGGWGNPPAQAQQWGAPNAAPAATTTAPAAPSATGNGWEAPAPEGVVGQAPAAWQNAGAPVPPPAPQPDPNEVAAKLGAMGVQIPPGCTLESLMGLAAVYGIS